jgi:hypothetical protein
MRAAWLGVALLLLAAGLAYANGMGGPPRVEPPTRFEAFLATGCSACVRDTYSVATLALPALKLAGFGPQVTNTMARPAEVKLEIVRAHPLGKPSQQFRALRATLSIATGSGPPFRLATAIVDEEQIPALAAAVGDIARTAALPPTVEPAPDMTEIEFRAGSLRVGTMRVASTTVAYVQAGDLLALPLPTVMEAHGVLFLSLTELPALQAAIGQVAERMQTLRIP